MAIPAQVLDKVLDDLVANTRNSALETAAKVAELYGASDEVCERIRRLKLPPPSLTHS